MVFVAVFFAAEITNQCGVAQSRHFDIENLIEIRSRVKNQCSLVSSQQS